ncbi:colanic acid biosynthesis glycosyltransferase WcaL [soil metagenome]
MPDSRPVVASYCTTFLKPEMLHIYRQVTGLREFETFVIAKQRQCAEAFPFEDVEIAPPARSNFLRRFWLKYVRREPPIVYRGEYGVIDGILRRRRADLMHVYFGHTGVHLLPFIRRWPKPVVVSFHGADVMRREDRPGYLENLKALLQEVPLVMARSHSLLDRLRELGCPEEKIRLNRTGIPMESFPVAGRTFPADGRWRFVQACRLIEKKGLDVALRAFARFGENYPEATFTVAGEGPLRASLGELATTLGVGGRVHFAGFLNGHELNALYAHSHAFVHPSQVTGDQNQEGVPNSMLEAMATGLPVLSTRHGGIPEAVRDGVSGILVPERDAAALHAAMDQLAREPQTWARMGAAAATDVARRFGQDGALGKLEEVYREALALGRPEPSSARGDDA